MTSADPDTTPRPWRSRFARLHPKLYIGVYGMAGMLATIGLVWLFLAIADEIPEHGTLARVDVSVARWLEAHGTEWGESVYFWVSYLGGPGRSASIAAAVLWFAWRRDWRRAIALVLTVAGGELLGNMLKLVFQRGRPETATEFITDQSWSYPSAHAMSSLIGYGFIAILLCERLTSPRARAAVVTAAVLLIGAISFSRLYLGVHYLSDVVGGWIAGAAWLLICVSGYRMAGRRGG